MKMFLKGEWVERDSHIDVVNPYNGEAFDTVPVTLTEDYDETATAETD